VSGERKVDGEKWKGEEEEPWKKGGKTLPNIQPLDQRVEKNARQRGTG